MLQLCFCMTIMSKSRISLLIRNNFWIFNDFLMLYCSICSCCWLCKENTLWMLSIIESLSRFLICRFWLCLSDVSSESLFTQEKWLTRLFFSIKDFQRLSYADLNELSIKHHFILMFLYHDWCIQSMCNQLLIRNFII